jgi:hypothetical protein
VTPIPQYVLMTWCSVKHRYFAFFYVSERTSHLHYKDQSVNVEGNNHYIYREHHTGHINTATESVAYSYQCVLHYD